MLAYPNAFILNSHNGRGTGMVLCARETSSQEVPGRFTEALDRELQWALNFQGSSPL